MGAFDFLRGAKVEEVAKKAGSGVRKQRNPQPTILALRLFKDGSIYPSAALVDKFDLNYKPATITKDEKNRNVYTFANNEQGNGFDVIDSRNWPGYQAGGHMLFIAAVPKGEPKVDLFKQVGYEESGKPLSSVMDQGTNTFGKGVLIPAVEELYGIKLGGEVPEGQEATGVDFVDLMVVDMLGGVNIPKTFSPAKGYSLFPKRTVRGDKAGEHTYERREKPVIYGLVPAELVEKESVPVSNDVMLGHDFDLDPAPDTTPAPMMEAVPVEEVEKLPYRP